MQFNSKEELYKRVLPALRTKKDEFSRLGYSYIKEEDIWNYLVISSFQEAHELMLSDIVSDIMHVPLKEVDAYLKETIKRQKREAKLDS
ncbi:MAG: hypothetical protein IJH18_01240 [Bacilli bacterium]|nr:hypothetical protein [Bacilli bacterium]